MSSTRGWQPDILGEGFQQRTLQLADDAEGEVVATLVRYRPPVFEQLGEYLLPNVADGVDVLYVHGWSDYFFQTHLATFWAGLGTRFYALDLRKYGRSLRDHQTPGYIEDLATYDEDIDAALEAMGHGASGTGSSRSGRRLVLLGHSTGGLTLSLWAARHQHRVAALVLNSPWLEFQSRQLGRKTIAPLIQVGARIDPLAQLPVVDLGFYTRSVSKAMDGEWEYNDQWRPQHGFPLHPGWLHAILQGHATVEAGLNLAIPVLTLLSARSTLLPRWTEAMLHSDVALDVVGVAQRALDLGRLVTIVRLDGALHDVFLSEESVRKRASADITTWARAYLRKDVDG
ncbi:alpha/beta hydrolase [Plantibacter sp. Mn2098]|uniref:alpha/beta hydrolase n=1 Tax=Plantibacter sp. Mn2098 TaxID=3395266 RepID=UPI003BC847C3